MGKYRREVNGGQRCPESGKMCLSRDDARRAAKTTNRGQQRDRWPVDAYHCQGCGRWHIGHVHTRRRKRRNLA